MEMRRGEEDSVWMDASILGVKVSKEECEASPYVKRGDERDVGLLLERSGEGVTKKERNYDEKNWK